MKRHTILIVDDEPNIRSSLTRLFYREAYDILLAESGEDAFHILRKKTISIVLSDYLMPGGTGVEFLETVKIKYPDSIRMILTGQADMDSIMRAVNQGVVSHFFLKPWDNDVLKGTMQRAIKVLEQKKRQQNKYEQSKYAMHIENIEQDYPGILNLQETTSGAIIIDD